MYMRKIISTNNNMKQVNFRGPINSRVSRLIKWVYVNRALCLVGGACLTSFAMAFMRGWSSPFPYSQKVVPMTQKSAENPVNPQRKSMGPEKPPDLLKANGGSIPTSNLTRVGIYANRMEEKLNKNAGGSFLIPGVCSEERVEEHLEKARDVVRRYKDSEEFRSKYEEIEHLEKKILEKQEAAQKIFAKLGAFFVISLVSEVEKLQSKLLERKKTICGSIP